MAEKFIIHGPKIDVTTHASIGQQLYDGLLQNKNLHSAFTNATTEKSISYERILEKSCQLAESLKLYGIKQNDIIAVISENSLEYFCPVLAALFLGCVVTTINPRYEIGEILHATNISRPTIIFCSEIILTLLSEVQEQIKSIRKIVVMDTENSYNDCESVEQFIANNLKMEVDISKFKPISVNENEVTFILYSSGTTGLPKGVMLSHKNINAVFTNLRNPNYAKTFESGSDVTLGLLPFFHTSGLCLILTSLLIGRQIILLKSFEPHTFLKSIRKYKITTLVIVPALVNFLAQSPLVDNYDLSSIETITCGGAPLSKRSEELLIQRLNVKTIRQTYGMTETTLNVLFVPLGENKHGSCGKVASNVSAKVVDIETGRVLGPLQEGELCFKGDLIMKGYVGDNPATKIAIDENGWLRTGDVAFYDEDKFFFIVDRIKELIKYKGFQVPPAELEAILLTHPKIVEAAVVGFPDERAGEVPVAFIVIAPDQKLTEKEVQDFIAKKVSPQKRLHGGVRFVNEIPKNSSGKILRRVLRELLLNNMSKL